MTKSILAEPWGEELMREYYHEETAAERLLRKELTRRKLCFRQGETIGGREIDFIFPQFHLAIEVDGFSHLTLAAQVHDRTKERILAGLGISLLRFRNDEVLADVRLCGDRVMDYIGSWRRNTRRSADAGGEGPLQSGLRAWAAKAGLSLPRRTVLGNRGPR